jgi:hypothetical protein
MPSFNNMFKFLITKQNKNSIVLSIEIYNKYFIIYHMYIRYKIHNILYIIFLIQ